MKAMALITLFALALSLEQANAQQPTPVQIVVQAAPAPAAPAPASVPAGGSLDAVKALQQAKAANAETLKKQEATLAQLDELLKAAEQLKIFSKRS